MTDSLLTDLQADLEARLRADEVLGGFRIVSERTGDILAEVERALGVVEANAERRGICLVVMQATGRAEAPDIPYPLLEVDLTIRVLEHPVMNNTGLRALTVARRVARVLWHYTPSPLTSPMVPGRSLITPVADPVAPVAYDVEFSTREAGYYVQARVARPVIAPLEATVPHTGVTITCATPEAAIYYTLDGSHPWPGNPGALPYTAPINISEAAILRAAAHLAGAIGSDVAAAHFETP